VIISEEDVVVVAAAVEDLEGEAVDSAIVFPVAVLPFTETFETSQTFIVIAVEAHLLPFIIETPRLVVLGLGDLCGMGRVGEIRHSERGTDIVKEDQETVLFVMVLIIITEETALRFPEHHLSRDLV
jgi:hypothetical protein